MDAATPTDPLARHSVIEVDTFCIACGYNLHGQTVTIDPQLGFPICRCPECGKFHPAGTGVSASTLWVRRFASMLVFIWIAIVLSTTIGACLAFFALSAGSVEAFDYEKTVPSSVNSWRFQMQLHDWRAATTPDTNGLATMMYLSAGSLVTGFFVGSLCVTLLWHWRRSRYLYVMLLPLISMAFLMTIYDSMANYQLIYRQCVEHFLTQMAIQCTGVFIGIMVGRKLSRSIVTMVVPPKPRQALAFLWHADGKVLPPRT